MADNIIVADTYKIVADTYIIGADNIIVADTYMVAGSGGGESFIIYYKYQVPVVALLF